MLFRPNVVKLASKRDTPGLVKALTHRDPKVRAAAAEALGEIGGLEATSSLLWTALTDQEERVCFAASVAFQRAGQPRDILEQGFLFAEGDDASWVTRFHVFRDRPPKRAWAGVDLDALLRLGGTGLAAIREGLRDKDWRVRESVASLLRALGAEPTERDLLAWYLVGLHDWGRLQVLGEAAIVPLASVLGHPRSVVRQNAARRLVQIGLPTIPILSSAVLDTRAEPLVSAAIAALEEIANAERLRSRPDPIPPRVREAISRHRVERIAALERALHDEAGQTRLL